MYNLYFTSGRKKKEEFVISDKLCTTYFTTVVGKCLHSGRQIIFLNNMLRVAGILRAFTVSF